MQSPWLSPETSAAKSRWISYNRARGNYASNLESSILELLFLDQNQCHPDSAVENCRKGISSVTALQIASAQGQRIYTITKDNLERTIGKISISRDSADDIVNAALSGKEITVHEKPISANGWSGSGYTIIDPENGTGSYMIDGRANGAVLRIMEGISYSAAAALGIADNLTGPAGQLGGEMGTVARFSKVLQKLQALGRYSFLCGTILMLIDIYSAISDDSLSLASKIGRISMALLSAGISAGITAGMVGLGLSGGVFVVLAALIAIVISISVTVVNDLYFSRRFLYRNYTCFS